MRLKSKVLTFFRTDGAANTASYLWRSLRNVLGLRVSETFFFRCKPLETPVEHDNSDAPKFIVVTDTIELSRYAYRRLDYVPSVEWFERGSTCYLGLMQGRVVSYCWAHQGFYTVDRELGEFPLKDDEVWIGPIFVDKRYRGLGIARPQLSFAIQGQIQSGKRVFLTAINSANHASTRSFAKCGFIMTGMSRVRKFGRWQLSKKILDINREEYLRKALR